MQSRTTLLLLGSVPFLAQAVTLTNFEGTGCVGNSLSCSNIGISTCCGRLVDNRYVSSTRATGLPPTGIASIHGPAPGNPNGQCGNVFNSGWGLNTCFGRLFAAGSMWHDICTATCKRDDFFDFVQLPENERNERLNERACKETVAPDKLTLSDGHVFEIGSGTSAEDVQALLDAINGKPEATIDDIPEVLLKHRIAQNVPQAWEA